jgi:hypothetical protein
MATGEETEEVDAVKSATAELGSRGGKAQAATMTTEREPGLPGKRPQRVVKKRIHRTCINFLVFCHPA